MFSKRLSVFIAAVILSGVVRGIDIEHQAAYDRVIMCMRDGFAAGQAEHRSSSDPDAVLCKFWKV